MTCRVRARFACAMAAVTAAVSLPAQAAELPAIKLTAANKVPECATPGRLMSFLEGRNGKLDQKFATIAADYMRTGEELKIRWDVAFFQMLLETGNLTFTGDVSSTQNNFAGLGATGKHEPGEKFPDVATGVKAHLQHLLMYSGEVIQEPVAERTRKVQEWGVLTSWQKTISGPMTFAQLAQKWAPGSKLYARDIDAISEAFYGGACNKPDPKPEMLALAQPGSPSSKYAKTTVAATGNDDDAAPVADTAQQPTKGQELARKANEDARASGEMTRTGLGATSLAAASGSSQEAAVTPAPAVKILNAQKEVAASAEAGAATAAASPPAATPGAKFQTASFGAGLLNALGVRAQEKKVEPQDKTAEKTAQKAPKSAGCKVWTASYGGSHAVIIKANADTQDNFTVLDVNEGSEKREADAYIAAYAKGGQLVGEYTSSSQALDKAFELCPEG